MISFLCISLCIFPCEILTEMTLLPTDISDCLRILFAISSHCAFDEHQRLSHFLFIIWFGPFVWHVVVEYLTISLVCHRWALIRFNVHTQSTSTEIKKSGANLTAFIIIHKQFAPLPTFVLVLFSFNDSTTNVERSTHPNWHNHNENNLIPL